MLIPFDSDSANNHYHRHYDQVGAGSDIHIFTGRRFQKGYGLGAIFGNLIRSALPMVKQGMKAIGKTALHTGLKIANDGLSGRNIKQSFARNMNEAGQELLQKSVGALGSTNRNRKNKKKRKVTQQVRRVGTVKPKRRKV